MKIGDVLASLLSGKSLPEKAARQIFLELFRGKLEEPKAKALLLLLSQKGESAGEVLGALKALRRLEPPYAFRAANLLDTCGTGGDASHSINVSTLAALVIAGAGGKVAKHGNRGLSSKCGSSDLLKSLGVRLNAPPKSMINSIRKHGIGYFHAPYHHPVFSRLQPLRQKIKTRTIFNLLGPLANPVRPSCQLVGVSRPNDFELYVKVLERLGSRAWVCHSLDGMDEISIAAPTKVAQIEKGKTARILIRPENYGFKKACKKDFTGGGPAQNKRIAMKLLTGRVKGPARDLVVLNAAAGLVLCKRAKTLREGIREAQKSLDSGKAYQALLGLKKASQN